MAEGGFLTDFFSVRQHKQRKREREQERERERKRKSERERESRKHARSKRRNVSRLRNDFFFSASFLENARKGFI
jgi:hypothetical protein